MWTTVMLAASCGGSDDGGSDDPPSCDMQIISVIPAQPEVGDAVVVGGSIASVNASGFDEFQWAVDLGGTPVEFSPDDVTDAREISFTADAAGVYTVTLMGTVGELTCGDASETINVMTANANFGTFRMRIVPPAGAPAPVQERTISIPGGADYALGTLALDPGVVAAGALTGPGGTPVAAYLRATVPATGQIAAEGFAGVDGEFALRMPYGTVDILVAPGGTSLAPLRSTLQAEALADLSIAAGDSFAGAVTASNGTPVIGARVALSIDDLPATVADTGAGGAFAVSGRAGSASALTIVPPAGSGLLSLHVADAPGLGAGDSIEIDYAPHGSRTLAVDVVGANAGGAWVTFIAREVAGAGTIEFPGGDTVQVAGSHRVTARANPSGALPALALPDAVYDVLIETDSGATWRVVDLRNGQPSPSVLAEATPAAITGQVFGAAGERVAGARVTARAVGSAGLSLPPTFPLATATSGDDGRFQLDVTPGLDHEISIDPPPGSGGARERLPATAPAAGQTTSLPAVQLRRAIGVQGRVTVTGLAGGTAGARVELYCTSCTGAAALAPVADAITDATGAFVLAVPDPGVGD